MKRLDGEKQSKINFPVIRSRIDADEKGNADTIVVVAFFFFVHLFFFRVSVELSFSSTSLSLQSLSDESESSFSPLLKLLPCLSFESLSSGSQKNER